MTNNWATSTISTFFTVTNGKTNTDDAVANGDYPLFDRSISIKYSDKYLFDTEAVIIPGEGKEFIPRYYSGKFDLHQRAYAIFPKENNHEVNVKFLYFWIDYFKAYLTKMAVGSTVKSLRLYMLNDFPIKLPPITAQGKIGDILSSIDEAIQKTDQIIQKSEELKSGLMNELLTKGIGHNKFKKTKLGEIPEEWNIEELSSIAKVERGKFSHRPRNDPRFYGGDIPFIQTGDVVNSKGRITKHSQTLNDQGLKVSKLFPKGTIVLTIAANIGDTGILEFDACFPDSLVGIQPNESVSALYLEYFLRTRKEYLNSIATQSAQKNINLEKLNPLAIVVPPIEEQKRIAEILSTIDTEIIFNKKDRDRLLKLKSGLMHDIFNQKVQIN